MFLSTSGCPIHMDSIKTLKNRWDNTNLPKNNPTHLQCMAQVSNRGKSTKDHKFNFNKTF